MARLPDSFLEELREKTDIVALISEYIQLKKRGNLYDGLCPFHNEKTPSFKVYANTASYYCFGCGAGGDAVTFIRNIQNLDYTDAVKYLADRAGMHMPSEGADDGYSVFRRSVLEANRTAARFYNELLYTPAGEEQLAYLRGRGLDDSIIRRFGLGAAPDDWQQLYNRLRGRFSDEILLAANLVRKSSKGNLYDSFRRRVVFPIIDVNGNVIAFGCRVLDDSKPKYINSSDTPVYKKSRELYALNLAKNGNDRTLILCEGYMDVIALHRAGFTNAVAGLGTALTEQQVGRISSYANTVFICYDSDEAGQKAAAKALTLFADTNVKVRVISLEGGKDPDDIIRIYGRERFREMLDSAGNDIEYRLLTERAHFDTDSADGKSGYLRSAAGILAKYGDPLSREVYAGKLSVELGVSKEAILEQIKTVMRTKNRTGKVTEIKEAKKRAEHKYDSLVPRANRNLRCASAQEKLLISLILSPGFYAKLADKIKPELFDVELYRRILELMCERIKNGQPVEMMYFSSEVQPEEMGELSKLFNSPASVSNTLQECEDCLAVLEQEDAKKTESKHDFGSIDDDEFRDLFKKQDSSDE